MGQAGIDLLIFLRFLADSAQHIETAEGDDGFLLGGLSDSGTDTLLYGFTDGGRLAKDLQRLCQISSR